jgi:hypothetical protein
MASSQKIALGYLKATSVCASGDAAGSSSRMLRSIRWIRSSGCNASGNGPRGALTHGSHERYHRVGPYAILGFNNIN